MINLRFEIDPEPARSDLSRIISNLNNMSDWVQQAGDLQLQFIEEGHASETDPDGARWAELAVSTQKSGSSILTETGAMRGNYTLVVSGNTGEISNDTEYFKYHKRGTSKMPQRDPLGFGAKHISEHERGAKQWLDSVLG